MPTSSVVGRIAAVLALIGAGVIVLFLLVGGGSPYTVTGQFTNASQLVTGNSVKVAGVPVGTIKEISLADDGQALVKMEISDESYAPLPQGTHATVRSTSLSGIANRYVSLDLPPEADGDGNGDGETIETGGQITQENTTSEVDLDEFFNTLNEETLSDFKKVIKGFARAYDGVGPQANKGFYYLNPLFSTSRRVFGELNSDQAELERLLVEGASLTGALNERGPDLEGVIANLNQMMGAIGRQEANLASAIGQLPGFMRQFNTTAVNLRAALDDVDPLIDASRPVARKLQPFMKRLRGFTRDAVPTLKRLDGIVRRPGGANDLVELTELQVPLAEIGVGPVTRNGQTREGALPASAKALSGDGLRQLEFFRPYITTEAITGWFDDFSHSGFPDAIGGIGRISTTLNSFSPALVPIIPPGVTDPGVIQGLLEGAGLDLFNDRRCPGSNVNFKEGGSSPSPTEISRLQYQDDPSYDDEPGGQLDCAGQDQTLPGSP